MTVYVIRHDNVAVGRHQNAFDTMAQARDYARAQAMLMLERASDRAMTKANPYLSVNLVEREDQQGYEINLVTLHHTKTLYRIVIDACEVPQG